MGKSKSKSGIMGFFKPKPKPKPKGAAARESEAKAGSKSTEAKVDYGSDDNEALPTSRKSYRPKLAFTDESDDEAEEKTVPAVTGSSKPSVSGPKSTPRALADQLVAKNQVKSPAAAPPAESNPSTAVKRTNADGKKNESIKKTKMLLEAKTPVEAKAQADKAAPKAPAKLPANAAPEAVPSKVPSSELIAKSQQHFEQLSREKKIEAIEGGVCNNDLLAARSWPSSISVENCDISHCQRYMSLELIVGGALGLMHELDRQALIEDQLYYAGLTSPFRSFRVTAYTKEKLDSVKGVFKKTGYY